MLEGVRRPFAAGGVEELIRPRPLSVDVHGNARAATVPVGCQKLGFADIHEGLLVLGSPRTRGATWKRLRDGRPVLAAGEPAAAFRVGRGVVELVVVVEG